MITVLRGVEVQHVVDEPSLKAGPLPTEKGEAGTGDLRSTRQIEDAEGFAQLPVGLRLEGERGLFAPLPHQNVVFLPAGRHLRVRDVRHLEEDLPDLHFGLGDHLIEGPDPFPHLPHLQNEVLGILPRPLELSDLF